MSDCMDEYEDTVREFIDNKSISGQLRDVGHEFHCACRQALGYEGCECHVRISEINNTIPDKILKEYFE